LGLAARAGMARERVLQFIKHLGDHLKTGHTGSLQNRPMRNRVRTLTYTLSDPSLAMDFHSRMESNIY
jgi:hypothetical protein